MKDKNGIQICCENCACEQCGLNTYEHWRQACMKKDFADFNPSQTAYEKRIAELEAIDEKNTANLRRFQATLIEWKDKNNELFRKNSELEAENKTLNSHALEMQTALIVQVRRHSKRRQGMKALKIIARAILILPIFVPVCLMILIFKLLIKLGEAGEWFDIETDYIVRKYLALVQKLIPFGETSEKGGAK